MPQGNGTLDFWRCDWTHRFQIIAMIHEAGSPRLLITKTSGRYRIPVEVEDRKTGVRGRVDYNGARIVEVHDYGDQRGHLAVPITTVDGRRYFLYWRFAGEFDAYEGLRTNL